MHYRVCFTKEAFRSFLLFFLYQEIFQAKGLVNELDSLTCPPMVDYLLLRRH